MDETLAIGVLNVYRGSVECYYRLLTPESVDNLRAYLAERERAGEKITPNSPRTSVDLIQRWQALFVKPAGKMHVRIAIHNAWVRSGLNESRNFSMWHAFRKFFKTQLERSGMKSSRAYSKPKRINSDTYWMWTRSRFFRKVPLRWRRSERLKPIQKPHPRPWIAGTGDKMLSIVARYVDVYNASGPMPSFGDFQGLMAKIADYRKRANRGFRAIRKAWHGRFVCSAMNQRTLRLNDVPNLILCFNHSWQPT